MRFGNLLNADTLQYYFWGGGEIVNCCIDRIEEILFN